ncbi:MAG: M20/M25/M40 family metallo-hydrolase, partial [Opitutales bacterium]
SCFSPPTDPFFRAMQQSVGRVRRRPARATVTTGFNDMQFFAQHLGIPTLGYGPGGRDYHAVDERARVKDLVQSAQIYAHLLTSFAG